MKKIFSLLAAVLFAGSMMAQTPQVTLDFTDAGWGFPESNTTTGDHTNGGYTISINATNAYKVMKSSGVITGLLYGKNGATIQLPAMTFDVSKIVVKGISGSSGKVTFNIFVGENEVSTQATSSLVDHEFPIAAESQAAGTIYTIKVTNANNAQISAIEFYEAVAGAPADPTFSVAEGVYMEAQNIELACETEGADIYYTLDGTTPSAESTLYSTPIALSSTTTIKAVAIKDNISSGIVSATYTFLEGFVGNGTEANPFTVADVYTLNNGLSGNYWVIGYIVGCAANGGALSTTDPVASNLALGDASTQTENILPVQLPNNTEIRTNLNLSDNPSMLGKQVKIYGSLETYFSAPGVKNPSAYAIVPATAISNTADELKAFKTIENGQLVIIKNGVRYDATGAVIR